MIVSWLAYTKADEKDMRERGIPTTKDLLSDIRKMLAEHIDEGKRISENGQQSQRRTNGIPGTGRDCRGIRKTGGNSRGRFHIDRISQAGRFHTKEKTATRALSAFVAVAFLIKKCLRYCIVHKLFRCTSNLLLEEAQKMLRILETQHIGYLLCT